MKTHTLRAGALPAAFHASFLANCGIGGIRVALDRPGEGGAGETEIKSLARDLKTATDEVKRFAETANTEIKNLGDVTRATKEAADKALTDMNALSARMTEVEQKMARRPGDPRRSGAAPFTHHHRRTVMDLSPIGEAALIAREGRRLEAYKDSVGVLTIGVGHTSAAGAPKVTAGLRITAAECDAIFARGVQKFVKTVRDNVPADLPQHAFDALVSLCFNIGPAGFLRSTVLRRLRAGDRKGAAEAILLWNRPAVIIPRRQAEYDQYRTPYETALPRARRSDPSPIAVAVPVAAALDKTRPTPVIEPVVVPAPTGWWAWLGGLFRSAPATEPHAETKGGATSA